MKTVKYGTYCLVGNSEEGKNTLGSSKNECKPWFSKKHNCMGRHVEATRGWTHSKWLKRMVKDHVVRERVPNLYSIDPRRIEIPTQGWMPPGMKVLNHPLV